MRESAHSWLPTTALLVAIVPLVCIPGAEWIAVSAQGGGAWSDLPLMFVFLAILAVPMICAALVGIAVCRTRRRWALIAKVSASYLVAFIIAARIGTFVRMRAFHRLAERSAPLIAAIHAFEQEHGRPPLSLSALTPEFIQSVPSTGMGAYPRYRIEIDSARYHGNAWTLVVDVASGGINKDQFLFFPLRNYPETASGGWLERVGDWAYVHE